MDNNNLLLESLAKAQGAYKPLQSTQQSAGGPFAGLADIYQATREALSANGLSIHYKIELQDEGHGAALLYSILGHSSGQTIISTARIDSTGTDRQTGQQYEYYKTQHTLLLLGIAPAKNDPWFESDDGHDQQEQHIAKIMANPHKVAPLDKVEKITKSQYADLLNELEEHHAIAKDILNVYQISTFADIPKIEYHKVLSKIRRIKDNYKKIKG